MTPGDWALRYAAAGWRVYPIEIATKKALFTGWQAGATADRAVIAREWNREPYPNVGVICGDSLAVFDVEAPHLPAFFGYLKAGGHLLPETPVSSTGGGGLHIFVQPIAAVATTRKLRLDGVHIGEFKTTGGVVVPPSRTTGGYRWLWWPDDPTPATAPLWLTALVAESAPAQPLDQPRGRPADPAAALDALACAVRDEPEGNRNSLLYWAACRARDEEIRPDIAAAVLRRAAIASGLDPRDAQATIDSALKRARVPA